MVDFSAEFEKVHADVEKKKAEQSALQERKRMLEEEKGRLLEQLKALGINSIEEAQAFLVDAERQLQEGLEKCQKILSGI